MNSFVKEIVGARGSLLPFATSLTHDVTRAQDLVQETITKALEKEHTFTPGTNLRAWLFTILRNEFLSQWRRRRREVEDPNDFLVGQLHVGPSQEWTVEYSEVLELIQALPTRQQEALMLVGQFGYSYEQTAEKLKCAVGTVKSRVNRARKSLTRFLESSYETPHKKRIKQRRPRVYPHEDLNKDSSRAITHSERRRPDEIMPLVLIETVLLSDGNTAQIFCVAS